MLIGEIGCGQRCCPGRPTMKNCPDQSNSAPCTHSHSSHLGKTSFCKPLKHLHSNPTCPLDMKNGKSNFSPGHKSHRSRQWFHHECSGSAHHRTPLGVRQQPTAVMGLHYVLVNNLCIEAMANGFLQHLQIDNSRISVHAHHVDLVGVAQDFSSKTSLNKQSI